MFKAVGERSFVKNECRFTYKKRYHKESTHTKRRKFSVFATGLEWAIKTITSVDNHTATVEFHEEWWFALKF